MASASASAAIPIIPDADQIHSANSYSSDSSGSSCSSESSDARPAATDVSHSGMRQESTFTADRDSAVAGTSCAAPATAYEARRLAKVRETQRLVAELRMEAEELKRAARQQHTLAKRQKTSAMTSPVETVGLRRREGAAVAVARVAVWNAIASHVAPSLFPPSLHHPSCPLVHPSSSPAPPSAASLPARATRAVGRVNYCETRRPLAPATPARPPAPGAAVGALGAQHARHAGGGSPRDSTGGPGGGSSEGGGGGKEGACALVWVPRRFFPGGGSAVQQQWGQRERGEAGEGGEEVAERGRVQQYKWEECGGGGAEGRAAGGTRRETADDSGGLAVGWRARPFLCRAATAWQQGGEVRGVVVGKGGDGGDGKQLRWREQQGRGAEKCRGGEEGEEGRAVSEGLVWVPKPFLWGAVGVVEVAVRHGTVQHGGGGGSAEQTALHRQVRVVLQRRVHERECSGADGEEDGGGETSSAACRGAAGSSNGGEGRCSPERGPGGAGREAGREGKQHGCAVVWATRPFLAAAAARMLPWQAVGAVPKGEQSARGEGQSAREGRREGRKGNGRLLWEPRDFLSNGETVVPQAGGKSHVGEAQGGERGEAQGGEAQGGEAQGGEAQGGEAQGWEAQGGEGEARQREKSMEDDGLGGGDGDADVMQHRRDEAMHVRHKGGDEAGPREAVGTWEQRREGCDEHGFRLRDRRMWRYCHQCR
ncbi:unnamed protein product [Closterium sp. NIES-54]